MTAPTAAVPVLPVSDLMRAVAWYERLGFVTRATYDGYAIVAFDGAEVHLAAFDDAPAATESFSGAYLRVDDADAVFAHWTAMGARTVAAPADQPYGIREFATEDLDGNLWRVGSVLEPTVAVGEHLGGAAAGEAGAATAAPPAHATGAGSHVATGEEDWLAIVEGDGPCPQCALVAGELHERALGAQVRDEVHAFGELLESADDELVRVRSAPWSWSALEYGVHVRDLLTVFAERVVRTLAETEPELGWWDHEAAIDDGMANESDVSAVVADLGRNAAKLSEALRLVDEDDWQRGATRRPSERLTIETMARVALHETVHHRLDAQRALETASA